MKKLRIWLFLLPIALWLPRADGSLITQFEPTVGGGNTVIDLLITNDDIGAIYDSGELTLLVPLAQSLWDTVPANQTTYADIGELVEAWNVSILPPPSGQVHNGWNRVVNADGSIALSNIGGIPDVTWTVWRDSLNFPNQNTLALTIQIPLVQLELDGDSGYNPLSDARIELGSVTLPGAFVGFTSGGAGSSASGQLYAVIPEPSSVFLLLFGVWSLLVLRRGSRKLRFSYGVAE
jgi:hypothetical protein